MKQKSSENSSSEEEDIFDQVSFQISSNTIKIRYYKLCKYSQIIPIKYPFNDISNLFQADIQEFQQINKINEQNICSFLFFFNKGEITIDNNNYYDIFKLAEHFKVTKILKELKKYREEHKYDIDHIITMILNESKRFKDGENVQNVLTVHMEQVLVDHIEECLHLNKFKNLPVSILYRIFYLSDKNKISSDLLLDIIKQSIDKFFVLLQFLDIQALPYPKFQELYDMFQQDDKMEVHIHYLPINLNYVKRLKDNEENNKKQQLIQNQMEKDRQNECKNLRDQLNKSQNENKSLKDQLNKEQSENKSLKDQLSKAQNENKSLKDQLNKEKSENKSLKDQLSKVQNESKGFKDILSKAQNESKNLKEQLSKAQNENKSLKDQLDKLQNESKCFKVQFNKTQNESKNLKEQFDKLQNESKYFKDQLNKAQNESKKFQNEIKSYKDQLYKSQNEIKSLKDQLNKARNESNNFKEQLSKAQKTIKILNDQHESNLRNGQLNPKVTNNLNKKTSQVKQQESKLDDSFTIVIDNGTGIMKAGFAGDEAPRLVFPSIVGYPKNKSDDVYVGNQSYTNLTIKYPIDHGIITDWDSMECIWSHIFDYEFEIDPIEHPILMTDPPLNTKENKEKIAQIMFETYNVPSFYLGNHSLLSLYSEGKKTGVVLDIGYSTTYSVPIYDTLVVSNAINKMSIGGRDLHYFLGRMLCEKGYELYDSYNDRQIIQEIKEKFSYVALDYQAEFMKANQSSECDASYKLKYKLNIERFSCPELLFQPKLNGFSFNGIDKILYDSIMKCDKYIIRKSLFENIILSGGSSLFKGLPERIEKEIGLSARPEMKIKVFTNQYRQYSAWIGGSIVGSIDSFPQMAVTHDEYKNDGVRIIHSKF